MKGFQALNGLLGKALSLNLDNSGLDFTSSDCNQTIGKIRRAHGVVGRAGVKVQNPVDFLIERLMGMAENDHPHGIIFKLFLRIDQSAPARTMPVVNAEFDPLQLKYFLKRQLLFERRFIHISLHGFEGRYGLQPPQGFTVANVPGMNNKIRFSQTFQ